LHASHHVLTGLQPVLNSFAAFEASERRWVRSTIIENVSSGNSQLFTDPSLNEKAFVPAGDVEMHLPMKITDYTDSFSSLIHAENVPIAVSDTTDSH
jgi:fumarylacetoacetase